MEPAMRANALHDLSATEISVTRHEGCVAHSPMRRSVNERVSARSMDDTIAPLALRRVVNVSKNLSRARDVDVGRRVTSPTKHLVTHD